jgi:hypothetical protein
VVFNPFAEGGNLGGGEKPWSACSVSNSNIAASDSICNQGGGTMLARRCRLSRSASHKGMLALCGG